MSLDLSWSLLDEAFASHLLATLDKVISNASKPDFIGPIHLSTLELGNEAPEVSIIDIGDVSPAFLDRDDGGGSASLKAQQQHQQNQRRGETGVQRGLQRKADEPVGQSDHFAKFAERNLPFGVPGEEEGDVAKSNRRSSRRGPPHRGTRLQTFRQYSDSVNAQMIETGSMTSYDPTASIPPTPASSHWGPGLPSERPFSSHGIANNPGGYFSAWQGAPPSASARSMPQQRPQTWRRSSSSLAAPPPPPPPFYQPPFEGDGDGEGEAQATSNSSSSLPSLQLHLSLHWNTSSIRVMVNTSLLINHPSPAFMSLPLSITITGLVLQAEGLLAFEVDQITNVRRGHFCLLVEEEGEGVSDEEQNNSQDAETQPIAMPRLPSKRNSTPVTATGAFGVDQVTPGERILSNFTLETSVGQTDKHVLRNVAKVERFVVSLVRKAVGDELVYPNFYSVELP